MNQRRKRRNGQFPHPAGRESEMRRQETCRRIKDTLRDLTRH